MNSMKKFKLPYFILSLGLFFAYSSAFSQKKWSGVVLYNLDYNGLTKNMIVDPVVRISKGKFSYPTPIPADSWDKADANKILGGYFNRFCKEEYPKGRKLDIFLDGRKAGSAKITELDTLHSCSPVVSEVAVSYIDSTTARFREYGLAISALPPQRPITKFSVDSSLEKSITEYVKQEFIRQGVKKEYAEILEAKDIRATDLDGDGKPEYLVTYMIIGETVKRGDYEPNMQYTLTLILQPTANGFKQIFFHYPEPGIPDETHYYRFIDILDLDGDGIGEVIIQKRNYSSWDYIVLKKKGDKWEEAYEGAGGGC